MSSINASATPQAAGKFVAHRFGPFQICRRQQVLLRDGRVVPLGSRSIAVLLHLLNQPGELVSKQELMTAIWPNVFVDEANLKVAVSHLRAALGDNSTQPHFIATVAGRGYRFIAPNRLLGQSHFDLPHPGQTIGDLPAPRDLIAREVEIGNVIKGLKGTGIITLAGPGGVGKTTIAVAVAHQMRDRFADGIWFVDLSGIADDALVAPLVASVMAIPGSPSNIEATVAHFIADRDLLLILDSCEHVLPGVRGLAALIAKTTENFRILATSREPLGLESEKLLRVTPLPVPDEADVPSGNDVLECESVKLFLTRSREYTAYSLDLADLDLICSICRCLNGLPLALEIAASRVACGDIGALLDELHRHTIDLEGGSTEVALRHRTLRATLDWSYQTLTADEALVLRATSIFAGSFYIEDLLAILSSEKIDIYRAGPLLGCLVSKSLVVPFHNENRVSYRLLDSTRAYAREQAAHDPDHSQIHNGYVSHCLDLLKRAASEWAWRDAASWRQEQRRRLNDIRQAIDLSFAPSGKCQLGVELTALALPLWNELSGVTEARRRVEMACRFLPQIAAPTALAASLRTAKAWGMLFERIVLPESEAAWQLAVEAAQSARDVELQLRALWGYAIYLTYTAKHAQALDVLLRFRGLASMECDESALLDGDRMYAVNEIYVGRLQCGVERLEVLHKRLALEQSRSRVTRFSVDRVAGVNTYLSFAHWLVGSFERSDLVARQAEAALSDLDHLLSEMTHLVRTVLPIACWSKEPARVERSCTRFRAILDLATVSSFEPVLTFFEAYAEYLDGGSGATRKMMLAVDNIAETNLIARLPSYLALLAGSLCERGEIANATSTINRALTMAKQHGEQWSDVELIRTSALISRACGDIEHAEQALLRAVQIGMDMNSLAFTLRAANDLTELRLHRDQDVSAASELRAVYGRFTEGFAYPEMVRAKELLAILG